MSPKRERKVNDLPFFSFRFVLAIVMDFLMNHLYNIKNMNSFMSGLQTWEVCEREFCKSPQGKGESV